MVVDRRRFGLALAVLCLAGVGVYYLTRPGDEKKIRRQFSALSECLRREPDSGTASLLLHGQRIEGLFAKECDFTIPSYGLEETLSPTEVSSELARAHATLSRLEVSFTSLEVKILSPTQALATCTIDVRATSGGSQVTDSAPATCQLEKIDGHWRFRSFAETPILEK